MELRDETVLLAPVTVPYGHDGATVLLDPAGPNWLATDARGAWLLERFDGTRGFGEVVAEYARTHGVDLPKARQHVETLARDALRQKFLVRPEAGGRRLEEDTSSHMAGASPDYPGRASFLANAPLEEFWLHTNNSCNLACSHCLVSSGPDGDPGLPFDVLLDAIRQARALGARRFYFTGGEPMVRRDFLDLVDAVLDADPAGHPHPGPAGHPHPGPAELAVLTNGLLLAGKRLEELRRRDPERLRLQISLDGSTPAVNDPIRGPGSFERIVAGVKNAVAAGLQVTLTTAITAANAEDVPRVTALCAELGVRRHHLLWLHKRGRADGRGPDHTPPVEQVIAVVRAAQAVGRERGVLIDNAEAIKARLAAPVGVRRDLSNACVGSLCLYSDGKVYPSAATVNVPELCLGDVGRKGVRSLLPERPEGCCAQKTPDPFSLEAIWRESPVARDFRAATVQDKDLCRGCDLKFLCGGGDLEHAYFYAGDIRAHDPYCELHKAMFADAFADLARSRREVLANGKSGYSAPVAFTGMGEGSAHCAAGELSPGEVATSHSECVVSFDLDAPRKLVRAFYGEAAETPQAELCCPVQPDAEDLTHIPREVVERFYGCGSPVGQADIRPGEVTLDLGSGAGIDVFIAAKKVGPAGRAIGVDMTGRMLEEARRAQPEVAANLGYDVAEFREGYLEDVPIPDASVDLVTSNCVINLSPDKKRVFREMWRVLKDHGRIVVSDIVAEAEVPAHQRRDPRLWGECISGALTEEEFLVFLERAGFYGVQVLRKSFWKDVEGHRFHSVTVRGWKFEKKAGCVFRGQKAAYQGPFQGVSDEEGHWFPRGVAIEVCTDTAAKLSKPPYAGQFLVSDPENPTEGFACCGADGAPCC